MAINNAKHIVAEIDGVRCTIIETGVSLERAAFLRDLLENNGLEVKELQVQESPEASTGDPKYTVGVTDLSFNPVFAIYERQLKNRDGVIITPAYWKQESEDCDPRYWIKKKSLKKV